jgi:hypothetical protein
MNTLNCDIVYLILENLLTKCKASVYMLMCVDKKYYNVTSEYMYDNDIIEGIQIVDYIRGGFFGYVQNHYDDTMITSLVPNGCYESAAIGHIEMLKWFIKKNHQIYHDVIRIAFENNHIDIFNLLIYNKCSFDSKTIDLIVKHEKYNYIEKYNYFEKMISYINTWDDVIKSAIQFGEIEFLKYIIANKKIDISIFNMYNHIYNDNLEILKQCCEMGFTVDIITAEDSLRHGNLPIIEWLYFKCMLPINPFDFALISQKVEVLEWLAVKLPNYMLGTSGDSLKTCIFEFAVSKNNKEMIDWILAKGIVKSQRLCESAIDVKLLDLVKECHNEGFRTSDNICNVAVYNNDLSMLKWAMKNDYKLRPSNYNYAIHYNNLDMIKYLYDNNCPTYSQMVSDATSVGRINILKWFHEKKFEFTNVLYDSAIECNEFQIFEWLVENLNLWNNNYGNTIAIHGRFKFLKLAYQKGLDLDFKQIYKICTEKKYYKICNWIDKITDVI